MNAIPRTAPTNRQLLAAISEDEHGDGSSWESWCVVQEPDQSGFGLPRFEVELRVDPSHDDATVMAGMRALVDQRHELPLPAKNLVMTLTDRGNAQCLDGWRVEYVDDPNIAPDREIERAPDISISFHSSVPVEKRFCGLQALVELLEDFVND